MFFKTVATFVLFRGEFPHFHILAKEPPVALEKPIIPTFSVKERDRRWSLLREAMKKADFDALIALPHEGHWDQFGCDTRYITQIGGTQTEVGCVVPFEADVTAVVRGENEIEWWAGARLGQGHSSIAPFLRRTGDRPLERSPRHARRRRRSLGHGARPGRRRGLGNL